MVPPMALSKLGDGEVIDGVGVCWTSNLSECTPEALSTIRGRNGA